VAGAPDPAGPGPPPATGGLAGTPQPRPVAPDEGRWRVVVEADGVARLHGRGTANRAHSSLEPGRCPYTEYGAGGIPELEQDPASPGRTAAALAALPWDPVHVPPMSLAALVSACEAAPLGAPQLSALYGALWPLLGDKPPWAVPPCAAREATGPKWRTTPCSPGGAIAQALSTTSSPLFRDVSPDYPWVVGTIFPREKPGKNGAGPLARIILDARLANAVCIPPPRARLPALLEELALPLAHADVFAHLDLRHWFYQFALRDGGELARLFCVRTRAAGPTQPTTRQHMAMRRLPMGWSWSPAIAQEVALALLALAVPASGAPCHVGGTAWLDNIVLWGRGVGAADAVAAALRAVLAVCERFRVTVKEVAPPAESGEVLGLWVAPGGWGLAPAWREKTAQYLAAFAERAGVGVSLRALQRLAGRVAWMGTATRALLLARPLLVAAALPRLSLARAAVTPAAAMLAGHLRGAPPCVRLPPAYLAPPNVWVAVDASRTAAAALFAPSPSAPMLTVGQRWWDRPYTEQAHAELAALVWAVAQLPPDARPAILTDCLPALLAAARAYSPSTVFARHLCRLRAVLAGRTAWLHWVPGGEAHPADAFSRAPGTPGTRRFARIRASQVPTFAVVAAAVGWPGAQGGPDPRQNRFGLPPPLGAAGWRAAWWPLEGWPPTVGALQAPTLPSTAARPALVATGQAPPRPPMAPSRAPLMATGQAPPRPPMAPSRAPLVATGQAPPRPPMAPSRAPLVATGQAPPRPPMAPSRAPLVTTGQAPPRPPMAPSRAPLVATSQAPPRPPMAPSRAPLVANGQAPSRPPMAPSRPSLVANAQAPSRLSMVPHSPS
jgi:hypothetical protein